MISILYFSARTFALKSDLTLNANIRAYKIVDNNLVYDEAKDAELQAEWEISSETILYKDNDGTTGSVFLDKSKTKFSKLKITAKSNTDTWQTIEIPTNVEQFRISIIDNNSSGTDAWIKQNTYILNDDEITFQSGFWRNINGNVSGQESAITIYEVIGYK